jgi:hypothetical protein
VTCPFESTPGHCWCGKKLRGRQTKYCSVGHRKEVVNNHRWTQARAAAKARVTFYKCERCGEFTDKVEVNHVDPILGKHGSWGCHHHQDGLEVLCKPCHLETTNAQRAEGKFKR